MSTSESINVTILPGTDPTGGAPIDETRVPSRWGIVFARFRRQKLALLGFVIIILLFLLAFVGPYFAKYDYTQHDFSAFLDPPSSKHWFGTTQTGGDLYALTLRGMQKSLIIGLLVAVISTGTAAIVGSFAGYFGGWTDRILMWWVDLLLVLPSFLITAILSPTFRGKTWLFFVVILAAFLWMVTARIVRGMTISLREREYVLAARFMGVKGYRVILRHVLPNISSLLIIDATINVSAAIISESGLSYFGFGIQPPDVSLGTLIADATTDATTYPWLFYFPAGMLVLIVLCVNLIGDGLRDALDPQSGGSH
jgi:peptide/nickel transport system permease protein